MHHRLTSPVVGALLAGATTLAAQATGTTTFNAPYRAFTRSEIGLLLSFPNGGGTAFEGAYRFASGKFDLGFKGGIFSPGGNAKTVLLAGGDAGRRVLPDPGDLPPGGGPGVRRGGKFVRRGSRTGCPSRLSLRGTALHAGCR